MIHRFAECFTPLRYIRNDVFTKFFTHLPNCSVFSRTKYPLFDIAEYDIAFPSLHSVYLKPHPQPLSKLAERGDEAQNAELFGVLNTGLADAGIAAWDTKYVYEQIRPITAIREADKDNNPNTTADPNWEPLLDTPDFPDYIC